MSAVAFDTLKFAQTLRDKAHVPQDQAEGMAEAFAEATGQQIATKSDLTETELRLEARIGKVETRLDAKIGKVESRLTEVETRLSGEINLLRWMSGFTLAILSAIALKLFLH